MKAATTKRKRGASGRKKAKSSRGSQGSIAEQVAATGIGVALELIKEPFYRVLDKILRDVGLSDSPPPQGVSRTAAAQERPREWHEILGVSKNATAREIRSAYKDRVQKLHPDKIAHMAEELIEHAGRLTQQLNEARNEGLARFGA